MASIGEHSLRRAVKRASSLAADPAALEQVVERFRDKYLVAVQRASRPAAREYAWESFRYYLVVQATRLKPFCLTDEEADAVLAVLRELVAGTVEKS